jgi:DNA topoisomerase I
VQMGDKTEENPKPKQTSLPKGVTPETLTLEIAVGLLALPRTLGTHPDTGGRIQTSLGRFGPYVVHDQGKEGKDYRSLKASDNVLTVNLERALEILSEPKKGRASSKSKAALRELGVHPDDEQPINIYDGPYGPYIKYAKTNVSIPEGSSVEDMTLEVALELLASKSSSGKSTRKTASQSKGTATKKSTAKSTTTKASSQKSAKSSTTATKKK